MVGGVKWETQDEHNGETGFHYFYEKKHLKELKKLKVIGDITCDVDGSVPTTIRSSTIEDPNYYLDKKSFLRLTEILNLNLNSYILS